MTHSALAQSVMLQQPQQSAATLNPGCDVVARLIFLCVVMIALSWAAGVSCQSCKED